MTKCLADVIVNQRPHHCIPHQDSTRHTFDTTAGVQVAIDYIWCLVRNQKFTEARDILSIAKDQYPNNPELYLLSGLVDYLQGNLLSANDNLSVAVTLDPNLIDGHLALGLLHLSKNQLDEAAVDLNRVLQIKPTYGEALYYLSVVCYFKGNYDTGFKFSLRSLPNHFSLKAIGISTQHISAKYRLPTILVTIIGFGIPLYFPDFYTLPLVILMPLAAISMWLPFTELGGNSKLPQVKAFLAIWFTFYLVSLFGFVNFG